MKNRFAALSPRALIALAVGGVLLWTVLLWFVLVSPKRAEVSRLDDEVAAAELRLTEAQAAVHRRPSRANAPVTDVFRLAKAMPASTDQSGLVLELTRLATTSGVTLKAITQEPSAAGAGGTTMIPVVVTVGGKFGQITRFLRNTRSLVKVRRGNVRATGRLFTAQSVDLVESTTAGFPQLDATITLNAFVYDGPIVPPAPPPTGDESQTDQTSGGTAAAGATH